MSNPSKSIKNEVFVWPARDFLDVARKVEESNDVLEDGMNTDLVGLASLINTMRKVPRQIKLLGVFGKAYVKNIKGKEFVIFKGHAGLRPNLKGTKYLKSNVLVKTLVVGAEDIVKDARGGFVLSFVCYTIIDVTRELSSDHPSLVSLGVNLSSDLLKCAVSTAAGAVAGVGLVLLIPGTPVVIAFVTVMIVGAAVGYFLDVGDRNYRLTEKAQRHVEKYSAYIRPELSKIERYAGRSASSIMQAGQKDMVKTFHSAAAMLHDML